MLRSEFTFVAYFRHGAVDSWDGWEVRRGMAALRGRGGGGLCDVGLYVTIAIKMQTVME